MATSPEAGGADFDEVEPWAQGNPLADAGRQRSLDAAGEDTDAVIVQDFFGRIRNWLCSPSDSGRVRPPIAAAVLAGRCGSLFVAAISPLIILLRGRVQGLGQNRPVYDEDGRLLSEDTLTLLYLAAIHCFYVGSSFLPAEFAKAIAIHPETGALALLGAGEKRVSTRALKSLRLYKLPLIGVCCASILYGIGMLLLIVVVTTLLGYFILELPYFLGICGALLIGIPCTVGWYFAMRVAATLAMDDVLEVANAVTAETLEEDEAWSAKVAAKATRLATHTMQDLSDGFGNGTGVATVMCWLMALAKLISLLKLIVQAEPVRSSFTDTFGPAVGAAWGHFRQAGPLVVAILAPLFIAADVAAVSTMCDRLYQRIVGLRLRWPSTAAAEKVNRKTLPLLLTLERLNNQQGLGFLVWGRVIDKRTLNIIMASVFSVFSTVLPIIVTLLPDGSATGTAADGRNCTDATADGTSPANDALFAVIRTSVLQLENASCFSNVTLGELADI